MSVAAVCVATAYPVLVAVWPRELQSWRGIGHPIGQQGRSREENDYPEKEPFGHVQTRRVHFPVREH
jgi:hypothetical protein